MAEDSATARNAPINSRPAARSDHVPHLDVRRDPASWTLPLDAALEVRTPEQVRFRYVVAGPMRRVLAYGIDLAVRCALLAVIALSVSGGRAASGAALQGIEMGALLASAFALEWGYFVACESLMQGQSIGKKLMGLRVVHCNGRALTFSDSVLRNLLRAADFLPTGYALGFLVMARSQHFRRIGDWAVGTTVIVERQRRFRPPLRVSPPVREEELACLPKHAKLEGETLAAVEDFLRLSPNLPPTREAELAELIAPALARRFDIAYSHAPRLLAVLHAHSIERTKP